jgi:predicted metal-dependent HD superfamily phosphohydrolase
MPPTTVPAWLAPAYTRAAVGAGATASATALHSAADRLIDRWTEPVRRYHDLAHLVDLLQHVDELQQEAHNLHHVRLAAWYHGAVFDAAESAAYAHRGGEDEAASAEFARTDLEALGVPADAVHAVAAMVEGLARHSAPRASVDAAVLSDADLAILASDPQRYRHYVERIREEYAHIPDQKYLEARRAIVERLLARDRLYTSPLGAVWERQARENLTAERARIDRELKRTAELSTESE